MTGSTFMFRRRRGLVSLVVLGGVVISGAIWQVVAEREGERVRAGFLARSQTQASVAAQHVNSYEVMVFSLRDLFVGQGTVQRDEFARVAQSLLRRYTGVQALEWVPIVTHDRRAAFEKQAAAELGLPFVIRSRRPDGTMHPSPEAAEYTVISYVEPLQGNEPVLGYDINTAPTAALVAAARKDKQFRVSQPIRLLQTPGQDAEPGVIFILPFVHPSNPDGPVEGFVQGVFHVRTLLALSHKISTNEALDTYYYDFEPATGQTTLLYANLAGVELRDNPLAEVAPPSLDDPQNFQTTLTLGDRQWRLVIRPNAAWVTRMTSRQPAAILVASLTITALLALFLNILLQRTQRIEQEVAARTRELRASEARLQDILDHSPAAISLKDVAGRYLLCNEQFTKHCQRSRDKIIGQTDESIFSTTQAALYRTNDAKVLAAGHALEFEETAPSPTGSTTSIVHKFPLLDEKGRPYALCAIATDITDRKLAEGEKIALERKMLEAQKLESLGVLAGGIAHDFNNILTTILGNAELAGRILQPSEPTGTHLEQIRIAARRAADLCRQMLAYAGRSQVVIAPVDLSSLVRETAALLEVSVGKNCRLQLELAPTLPAVHGDESQLRQIVMNLVINASDAIGSRQDGRIAISTFARQVSAAELQASLHRPQLPAGEYVGLEVSDNGVGMAAETLQRIFEPFFTTKFSGRGLGLSAVLGIVQGHHGALYVDSQPGKGSTFRLMLPASKSVAAVALSPTIMPNSKRIALQGTFLVVDDEETVRSVTAAVLRVHGGTVLAAADGTEALRICKEHAGPIDLILLDLTMPGISGEETLRRLRMLNHPYRVLVMSGYSEQETKKRCADLGTVGFIAKPFDLEELLGKIQALLGY